MTPDEIKALRKSLGVSQEGLAQMIGIGVKAVHYWENGKSKPNRLAVEKLKLIREQNEVRT